MIPYKTLFDAFKRGLLEDDGIEELNHLLIDTFFHSTSELNSEELEYTEDLVIEQYSNNLLEMKYLEQFEQKISKDIHFREKFSLLNNLNIAIDNSKNEKLDLLLNSEIPEGIEKEEKQLENILKEVIKKVHSEEESKSLITRIRIIFEDFNTYLGTKLSSRSLNQPQIKLAFAAFSVLAIIGIVRFSVNISEERMQDELITGSNKISTPPPSNYANSSTNERVNTELSESFKLPKESSKSNENEEKEEDILSDLTNEPRTNQVLEVVNIYRLITTIFKPVASFDYLLSRGELNHAQNSYVIAAEMYNIQNYDSCISILSKLLNYNSFEMRDTINEMNFYLGICYLSKGIKKENNDIVKLSILAFERVDNQSLFFLQSKWYSSLGYALINNFEKSKSIIDSLLIIGDLRQSSVKELRDSLEKFSVYRK